MKRFRRPGRPPSRTPDHPPIPRLRHTFAALMIADGAHAKELQQMGHSSITVTFDRYGHVFPERRSELASRLDAQRSAALTQPEPAEGGPARSSTCASGELKTALASPCFQGPPATA